VSAPADAIDTQMARRAIEAVNREVSLVRFLNDEGYPVQGPDQARSIKTHCPWGWTHPDGGMEKSFRVYGSNTGFCFGGCGFINPVIAAERLWEIPPQRAARELAARYHVSTGDLATAVAIMQRGLAVDRIELVDALRRWCDASFTEDERIDARRALARCASVVELIQDASDAARWWEMSQILIFKTASQSDNT